MSESRAARTKAEASRRQALAEAEWQKGLAREAEKRAHRAREANVRLVEEIHELQERIKALEGIIGRQQIALCEIGDIVDRSQG